jgi:3-deoxy-manno-octulosonate cytidylyltransferase (CMP-KDO synthetase)
MVQGDEPLIHHKVVDHLLSQFTDNTIHVANVMSQLKTDSAFKDKNNIKVVIDQDDNALYFSREPIPSHWSSDHVVPRYMQTGVIAFRRNALLNFNNMEETPLEQIESIDMNRILETGGRIKMVLTDLPIIGVDTPNDLIEANRLLETDALVELYI